MAVDIKTLHFGSHVLVKGERVRVCGITRRKIGYHATGKPGEHLRYARLNEVEPITITPDLLKELGLVKEAPNIVKRVDDYFIYFHYLHDDLWRIGMYDDTYNYGNCIIRHLHEAEAFLGLHGVELIKD